MKTLSEVSVSSVVLVGFDTDTADSVSSELSVPHRTAGTFPTPPVSCGAVVVDGCANLPDNPACDTPVLVVTDDPDTVPEYADDYIVRRGDYTDELADRLERLTAARSDTVAPSAVHERITDGFFAVDTDWRFTYVNDRAAEVLERNPDELIGENGWDEFPEATEDLFWDEFHRAMEEQEPVSFEEYYEPLDTWFDMTAYLSEAGLSVYFRDVTERKRRERELRETRERYKKMVEQSRDGVALVQDAEWRFVDERLLTILGETEEAMLGEPFYDWFDEGDRELVKERYEERVVGDEPENLYEVTMVTSDSGTVEVEVNVTRIRNEGEPATLATFRDVTKRKRRERELEEYETVMESVDDAIYVLDNEGRFRYVNSAFTELVGYDTDEVIGSDASLIKDEEAVREAERNLARVLSEDGPDSVKFEIELMTKDGDTVECEDRITVLPYEGGEFRGSTGVLRDITQRKRRERELERYKSYVENSRDVISLLDENAEFVYNSPSVEELLGYEQGKLVGEKVYDYIHPDDRDEAAETFTGLLSRPDTESATAELRLRAADGSYVWFESVATDRTDMRIGGVVVNGRDVTERKRREHELRLMTRAVEKADTAFCLSDPTQPDNPLIYVNSGFEELTGYQKEEAEGRNCRFLQGPETEEEAVAELRRAVENEESAKVELLNYKKDGTPYWNQVHISPIYDEDGELVSFVGSQRDVTEFRERREELSVKNSRLNVLYETVNSMISATSSVQVRQLVRDAPEELGHDAEYYVWEDAEGDLESISSDTTTTSGPVWAAYTSGEPFLAEDILAYPVSDDGVLYVSAESEDEELEDFLSSLSASAEAALGRFETRSEILELAETLEERKERLDSLVEVDTVLRELVREIPRQNDRLSVERVACESLLDISDWDFAWVASPTADSFVPRASSDDTFADSLSNASEMSLPEPAARAVMEDEAVFVDNIAREPTTPWRRASLDRGYLSVASLPVSHSETSYGVLQVYSKEPEAFPEEYATALKDAARMVGYAVSATDRGTLSEEPGASRVTVALPGAEGPLARIADHTHSPVIVDTHASTADGYTLYFRVPGADTEEVKEAAHPTPVEEAEGRLSVETHGSVPLRAVAATGGALDVCRQEDGRYLFELGVPPDQDVREVVERITDVHPDAELIAHTTEPAHSPDTDGIPETTDLLSNLTERQREALETAYYEGFFDSPKSSTGEDVADQLGISGPTLHQHLRSAERKLFDEIL